MTRPFDVVVIGAGITGTAAALAAAARGAHVGVVRAGPGVSGLCSGAWNGALPQPIARALERAGLPHVPCERPLPHPDGDHRSCSFAPASHAAARVDGDTLVCGIAGLPGFRAAALARLWTNGGGGVASRTAPPGGEDYAAARDARHLTITLDGTPAGGWSCVALAAALDRDATLLAAPLARALRETAARRVVLPAVLGIENTAAMRATLIDLAGVEVAETLGNAPSLPGWRLARALEHALREAGVELMNGRATHTQSGSERAPRSANGNRRVGAVWVGVENGGQRNSHDVQAKCFVLATGKFAGGGIAADGRFAETTFGLPVWIEHIGRRFYEPGPLVLTNLERRARQPLMSAGVRADDEHRPIDENGDVVYENVLVAGSVRAGLKTAELPLGDAALDGWRAGELAARSAA